MSEPENVRPTPPTAPPIVWEPAIGKLVTVRQEETDELGGPVLATYRGEITDVFSGEVVSVRLVGRIVKAPNIPGAVVVMPLGPADPRTLTSIVRARQGVTGTSYRPYIPTKVRNDLPREDAGWEERRRERLEAKRAAKAAERASR